MAKKVVIDVEARFIDNVTGKAKAAAAGLDKIGDAAEESKKDIDALGKAKAKPKVDADDSKFLKKMLDAERKTKKLGQSKASVMLDAIDNASKKMQKVLDTGKRITSKVWSAAVKIKDYATTPLRKIKDTLFSIKTLIGVVGTGLATGFAAQQLIAKPVSLADTITSSKIAFESKLGSAKAAEEFLQSIYKFDEKSPFDSIQIVGITQQMMNMGWEANNVLTDLEKIGDWAASMGKGEEGISRVTLALGQMRQKGKLSSEEMLQLTEAGVSGWDYLAKYLGKSIPEVRELAEDGAIDVNEAIKAIITGMEEFAGASAANADKTVSGIFGQLQSLIQTNITLPWGEGLSTGLKKGLSKFKSILEENKNTFKDWGQELKGIGEDVSVWLATKLNTAVRKAQEIMDSDEFKNASWSKKIGMLWDGIIANPFSQWWENDVIPWWDGTAIPWIQDKAGKLGTSIGKGLSDGLLTLLGVDVVGMAETGSSVAGSFVQGFKDGFDGSAVTDAFVDAISNVWNALPGWAKLLLGGYGALKVGSGVSSLIGGASNLVGHIGSFIGTPGNAMVSGTGLSSLLANVGYGATGGAAGSALSGGAAALTGLGVTAGLATGAATAISGGVDLYNGFKNNDAVKKKTGAWKTGGALGGAAAGAAIGTALGGPLIGTALGALAGSVVGWWQSSKIEEEARKEAEKLQKAAEKAKQRQIVLAKIAEEKFSKRFGNIRLSAAEVEKAVTNMIGQDVIDRANAAGDAIAQMESSYRSFTDASSAMRKTMWLSTIERDAKLTNDQISDLKTSVKELTSTSKTALDDSRYAASAAISALMGDSDMAKKVQSKSGMYFAGIEGDLTAAQAKLSETVDKALSDGVISLDEEESINKIREQINSIMRRIQEEENTANMNILKAQYGDGEITLGSFQQLQNQGIETAQSASDGFWKEFGAASIGIEEGTKEWNALLEATLGQISGAWAEVGEFSLGKLQDKMSTELGVLGQDIASVVENTTTKDIVAAAKGLSDETRKEMELWLDSMAPTTEEIQSIADRFEQAGLEIPEAISSYLNTVDFYEACTKGERAVEDYLSENTIEINPNVKVVDGFNPYGMLLNDMKYLNYQANANVDIAWVYNEFTDTWITPDGHYGFTTQALLDVGWTYDKFKKEWISPDKEYSFTTKVNVHAIKGSITGLGNIKMDYESKQRQLFGGSARGDIWYPTGVHTKGYAAGGMVRGGSKLIRVAEEGTPEMIIPLGSQRRERAMKLWAKTGHLLGAPGFARGGNTSGNDEGFQFNARQDSEPIGGQSVQVDVGGITLEIHVEGSDVERIRQAIKEQINEIAEDVAGVFADAFAGNFENTPVRGGA